MKVILYMAISADGFIARNNGDSDWVSENDSGFTEIMTKNGNVVVGRKTFDQYYRDIFPVEGVTNFVLSAGAGYKDDNVVVLPSPDSIVEEAENRGIDNLVVVGGGKVNQSFLESNLIDEIQLVVHPLILSNGMKLFGVSDKTLDLEFIKSLDLGVDGLVRLYYKIKK